MAMAAMMAASIAVSAIQTSQKNRQLKEQQAAANAAAVRRVDELRRQQERASLIAQEEKSDLARQSDIEIGRMIAVAADGGQTVAGLSRLAAARAAVEGVDIARVESNRVEDAFARRADSVSIVEENFAMQKSTRSQIRSNTLEFFGNAVGAGIKYGGGMGGTTSTPIKGTSTLPNFTDAAHRPGPTTYGRR